MLTVNYLKGSLEVFKENTTFDLEANPPEELLSMF